MAFSSGRRCHCNDGHVVVRARFRRFGCVPRMIVAGSTLCIVVFLCRGDKRALGIRLHMHPSYTYWIKAALLLGSAVGLICLGAGVALHLAEIDTSLPELPPEHIPTRWIWAGAIAPVYEELIYRLVLCVPLVAVAGPRVTIVLGGAVFAGLHFVYGNPAPDNFVGGYILVWAYLKSGSIATPIVLHSLGNSCVVAVHVLNWHLMQ